MSGVTDLGGLLAALAPALDPVDYVFASLPDDAAATRLLGRALMLFREAEGTTLIVPAGAAAEAGLAAAPVFRRITLGVHSSLAAVGLTAAVSRALTAAGISANVVAAYYHDHVFVPADDAGRALDALASLQRDAAPA